MQATSRLVDKEVTGLLSSDIAPFISDPQFSASLKLGVEEELVHSRIRKDAEVERAISKVKEAKKNAAESFNE